MNFLVQRITQRQTSETSLMMISLSFITITESLLICQNKQSHQIQRQSQDGRRPEKPRLFLCFFSYYQRRVKILYGQSLRTELSSYAKEMMNEPEDCRLLYTVFSRSKSLSLDTKPIFDLESIVKVNFSQIIVRLIQIDQSISITRIAKMIKKNQTLSIGKIYINIMRNISLLVLLLVAVRTKKQTRIPPLNQNIGDAIFQQTKPYLIYVTDYQNEKILNTFEEYCKNDKLCTILDSENQMYEMLNTFVGMNTDQYLLILDSTKYQKFTLPIDQTLTVQQIDEFYSSFQAGTLERYFTSQQIPTENIDPYLVKVVGRTYENFINRPANVKILFLFSDDQGCTTCKDVYDILVKAAKAFPDRNQVQFGHFDLFRNDHKLLKQVSVPVVLVYTNPPEYIKLESLQKIQKIQQILNESLAFMQL